LDVYLLVNLDLLIKELVSCLAPIALFIVEENDFAALLALEHVEPLPHIFLFEFLQFISCLLLLDRNGVEFLLRFCLSLCSLRWVFLRKFFLLLLLVVFLFGFLLITLRHCDLLKLAHQLFLLLDHVVVIQIHALLFEAVHQSFKVSKVVTPQICP